MDSSTTLVGPALERREEEGDRASAYACAVAVALLLLAVW